MSEIKIAPPPKPKEKKYVPPMVIEAFIKGVAKKNLFKDKKPLPDPRIPK